MFERLAAVWLQNGRQMGRRGGQDKGKTRVRRQLGRSGLEKEATQKKNPKSNLAAPAFCLWLESCSFFGFGEEQLTTGDQTRFEARGTIKGGVNTS